MLAIDHIVIAAKDPALAAREFGKKNNAATMEGGKHSNWGTYNYLAYFQNNCYIEWLGIFDEDLARKSDNPLIQQLIHAFQNDVEGQIQIALRTDNMDKYVEHFQESGISYTGPIPGNRKKPDGSGLEWRMLFPESQIKLPFLIEWGENKNLPQDDRLINDQQIRSIDLGGGNRDIFHQIFQLNIANNSIQLDNGQLYLSDSGKLDFDIK